MRFLRSGWFLGFTSVIVLVGGWFFWGANWLADRKWNAYLAEARARGVVFSWAELVSPLIPKQPSPTGRVFKFMPPDANAGKLLAALPGTSWDSSPSNSDGRPMGPDWKKFRQELVVRGIQVNPTVVDDVRAIYEATTFIQPLVEELIQTPDFASHFPKLWSEYADTNGVAELSRAILLLRFAVQLEIARKEAGSAREILITLSRLGRTFESIPTVWKTSWVAVQADGGAVDALWYGLEMGLWSDDVLRMAGETLLQRNHIRHHRWGLLTDRAHYHESVAGLLKNGQSPAAIFGARIGTPLDRAVLEARASRRSWWRENQLWIEGYYDEEIAEFDGDAQRWSPLRPRQFDPDRLHSNHRRKLELAYQVCSQWRWIRTEALYQQGQSKMGALACALELHRRAAGKYPETLDRLVPTYLSHLPIDPCGGESFRYGLEKDGNYFLYSIGENLKDDGGRTQQHQDDTGMPDWRWWAPRAK